MIPRRRTAAVAPAVIAIATLLGPAAPLAPAPLSAQIVPVAGPGLPPASWTGDWSPLRPLADLPRPAAGAGLELPGLLIAPAPRTGLFWTTGNPGALPFDVDGGWSGYRAEAGSEDGAYRRPLDPASEERTRVSVEGWSPAGPRSAAAGRLVLDRVVQSAPALADVPVPYGSSPLVVMDTAHSDLGGTAARMEGGLGASFGPFALGLAVGFDALEARTVEAAVPNSLRSASPAATIGAAWRPLPSGALTLGVHGRWQRTTHALDLYSLAAPTRVFQLAGYGEPSPIDVVATFYNRDIERTGREVGTGVALELLDTRLLLFGDLGEAKEEQTSSDVNDPPVDTWNADQFRWGAAADRAFLDDRLRLIGSVVRTGLSGQTTLHELDDDVVLTADEDAWDLALDARLDLARWRFGARLTGAYDARAVVDSTVGGASEVRSWTTGAALEVARPLGAGLTAAAALAAATHRGAGALIDPESLGDAYRAYVAPEVGFRAADASATAAALTLRWDPSPRAGAWLHARYGTATPAEDIRVPYAPRDVDRSGWGLAVGVALGGGGR